MVVRASSLPLGLVLLLGAMPAAAQITVTEADVVSILTASGTLDTFELEASSFAAIQTVAEQSGEDQTWDVSALAWRANTGAAVQLVTPPVPGSDTEGFDAATHISEFVIADSVAYIYARVSDAGYEQIGTASEAPDGAGGTFRLVARFAPSLLLHPLPLTTASTWTSDYQLDLIPDLGFLPEPSLEDSSWVEGWGTLVTPDGSVEVLKTRTRSVTTLTVPFVTVDTTEIVRFISRRATVAEITLDTDGTVVDGLYSRFTASEGTAADPEAGSSRLRLSLLSANPVRRGDALDVGLALDVPAAARVDVFDALGRRVAGAEATYGAGLHRVPIATEALSAGVYVVRLGTGGEVRALTVTVVE
ncbi:MAG: T9SS type A sorting domain-containing protein [Bacteroidota bacterium]